MVTDVTKIERIGRKVIRAVEVSDRHARDFRD